MRFLWLALATAVLIWVLVRSRRQLHKRNKAKGMAEESP
jgi:hypothetical protein